MTPVELVEEIDEVEEVNALRDAEDGRIRFSRLKLMAESPMHYQGARHKPSTATEKGTAVHALLSGLDVTFYPEKTKDGKSAPRRGEKWEKFRSANQDKIIVTSSEYDEVGGMIDSIRSHGRAMELLQGTHEETLKFKLLGLDCRSTPDSRNDRGEFFVELKTTRSSKPSRFAMQSFWMAYHAQCALHRIAIKRTVGNGKDYKGYIIAVESARPWPVTVFPVSEKAMLAGDKQIRIWMEMLKGCLASNQWPPYAQSDVELDVPEDDTLIFAGEGEAYSADKLPDGWA